MANNMGTKGKDDFRGTTGPTGGGATGTMDKARDMASNVADRAKDAAGNVADKAKDMASNVADTARDWASSAASAVSTGVGTVADKVRDSDVVNKAGEYAQEAWETGSRYWQEHSVKDMADDLAGVIRRNPIPALLVGIGLGYLLARSTSRS